jgi:hypothetical protein
LHGNEEVQAMVARQGRRSSFSGRSTYMKSNRLISGTGELAVLLAAGGAAADEIRLPGTLIWNA